MFDEIDPQELEVSLELDIEDEGAAVVALRAEIEWLSKKLGEHKGKFMKYEGQTVNRLQKWMPCSQETRTRMSV